MVYTIGNMNRMNSLYTIGYEGRDIKEFTGRLKDHGVETLVDVRDIPFSRKKGFSKTPLSEHLREEGIEYVHIKKLGSPKSLRDKVREDGDYDYFYREYTAYIQCQQDSVETLYQIAAKNSACIMCYEKEPDSCHRRVVAEEVKKRDGNGLTVHHI